jgi:hypothetical protein
LRERLFFRNLPAFIGRAVFIVHRKKIATGASRKFSAVGLSVGENLALRLKC